jgi:hypothetical protein
VQRFGEGDLTARAEWFATDVMWGTTPDARVTFRAPGVPEATERVRVFIGARVGTETDQSPYSYETAPGARPSPLAALSGFVYEGDSGLTGLSNVTVEILDGDGTAGLSATTNGNGFYIIFHLRVGVPFTIRASKVGYEPAVAAHQGIMPSPQGFPDSDTIFQHLRLKPR